MNTGDYDDFSCPTEECCVYLPAGYYENYQPKKPVKNSSLNQQQQLPSPELFQPPPLRLPPPPLQPQQPREQLLMQDDSSFNSINIDYLSWPTEEYCAYLPAGYYENYQPKKQVKNPSLNQQQQLKPRELFPPRLPPHPLMLQQPREQLLMLDHSSINIDYQKLVSFLEVDTSFLTLWNWKTDELNQGAKKVMKFEAESLFSVELPTQKQ